MSKSKLRISLSIFLSLVMLFNSIAPALAEFKIDPVARSPFMPRGLYNTDLFTGSAGYSYPIKVPKGTDDLTPNISLSYNSSSTFAPSVYAGMGWDLNRDYIERDVNYTAGNTGDDKFKLFFQGQMHELVYVSSEGRYHTKIESNLYITKLTTGEENESNEYWQVITPDGTKYRFGQASNSELMCNGRSYAYRWNLDLATDVHDNKIYYTYTEDSGASYLSQVKYNNDQSRIIDFTYATNTYQKQVYVQGCNITETSRLSNIQAKINTSLVHQFDLGYTTTNSGHLLESITEKGSDGASALPATKFDYKSEIKSWATSTGPPWIDDKDIDAPLNSSSTTLTDVNGDGLPDIVKSYQVQGGSAWKVLLNTGSSWPDTWSTWASPISDDPRLDRADTRLMDVTGDSLPDIVQSQAGSVGGKSYWRVWENTGSSWNTSPDTSINDGFIDAYFADSASKVIDVNGDGLADIIKSHTDNGAPPNWKVYKNTGSTWNTSYENWQAPQGLNLGDTNIRLLDANGDGLPDIVKTTHSGTTSTWYVYKNTGSGWSTSAGTPWINGINVDAYFENNNIAVTDVNGDGLPDIVKSDDLGTADRWNVLINKGNGWLTTYETWIDPSANVDVDVHNDNVRLADVDGDGLTDIVRGQMNCSCGRNTYTVWKNNGKSPHLLQTVYALEGGKTSFDYKSSTGFDNTGPDSLSDLPFPLWVVEKMTVNNGMTNSHQTNDITTYSYKDGFYDWEEKEFRGFADVNTTEPNGSKKKYVFKQDDITKGRLDELQHRDSSSNPYVETDNTWSVSTTSGVMTIKLDTEKFITYDATTSGAKTIQNDYIYDSYGNITKKSELGDTSTSSDNRYIYNEYTASASAWIVNTLKHTYLNKSDDSTKVSESWVYYDGNANWTDAPTKGDLTKKVDWLSGGTNPQTTYAYDSYGNQTSMTDANNHTTSTVYDTATHTYPISTTNAKNQTTTMSYDLGTGNLLSKTDPNGFSTTYEYDVFGRIIKEIKPYDSSASPSASYAYFFDGIAPEGMVISKLETASSPAVLDIYTYIDGLGRKIQTRTDAEDISKQIVKDIFYDPTGEIKKETVSYFATSSAITSPPPATKFGDGSDGDIIISSNTTEIPIDSIVTAASGSATATVGSGFGFMANQIVLFHQTQGTSAGTWEIRRVKSYSGTTLTLTTALSNSYSSSGSNHAQVRVVPQYHNVTVNSGVTWTAKAWNGTTGGIFAFFADGTVINNGTITATGKGFVGGQGALGGSLVTQQQGEGAAGVGSNSTSSNGTGAGGGKSDNGNRAAGGGGGGHALSGTNGSSSGGSDVGGTGGVSGGTADLATMVFGGAGGAGASWGSTVTAKNGGNSGGIIFIAGATITSSGSIANNGSAGINGGSATAGGGGGGAGGAILLKGQTITLGTNLTTATGGSGGSAGSDGVNSAGGAGANGRIRVEYETTLLGTTNPTVSSSQNTISLLPAGESSSYGRYVDPDLLAKYTQWSYDAIGRPNIITNPKGDSRTIAYDHWKETTIDENGHIKREYKNAFDKIWKVEEVNGINTYTTTYEYDSRDLLTKITDNSSNQTTFTYNSLGRKTSQVDPDMGTWSYGYDAVGNLTSQTDNRNITTNRTYDELDRLTKVDYPTQTDNSFAYDIGKIGTLSIATDSAGTVNYSYDNRLRKTQEQRTINGTTKTTQFSYDAMDRLKSQTYPDGEVVNFSFNNQGEIEGATGSATLLSNVDYNALGKITSKAFGNGLTTNYTYHTNDFRLNRIQTASNAAPQVTLQDLNYTYDNVGNVKTRVNNLTSKTETFGYDDLDRLISATESAGYNFSYEYNPLGNLTKFINAGINIDYSYGSVSALPHALASSTETATPSASYLFSDDWSSGSINTSKWNNWGSPQTSVSNGQLQITSTTSPNYYGVNTVNSYNMTDAYVSNQLVDAGNQSLTSWEAYPIYMEKTGDESNGIYMYVATNHIYVQKKVNWTDTFYDLGTYNSSTHKYFRMRESNGSMYFDTSANGTSWTNQLSFADPFTLTSMKIGNAIGTWQTEGSTTNAKFDNFIYSTSPTASLVDDWSSISTTKWDDQGGAQTNSVSNQLKIDSTTSANYFGLWSKDNYDLRGSQITSQLVNAGNQSLTSWEVYPIMLEKPDQANGIYVYVSGNHIYLQTKVNLSDSFYDLATYNSTNHKYFRVKEAGGTMYVDVSADGKTWTTLRSQANPFTMNSLKIGTWAGNYQNEASTTNAIFDNMNILPAGMTYIYDANGNMTSDGTNCYQYNQANQLDKVTKCSSGQTVAEYVYDYNGNRMVKRNFTGGNQLNSVISWSDAFETTVATSGAQLSSLSYYFVNNELVAKKNNDGSRNFFHNDHLGSASVISSASGTLVEETKYDPWGEILSGGTANKFLYTGQEHDTETGLDYYNFRYYNSDIRRFTQPDDIIQDLYNPQDLNKYTYVRNNPLKYTDPTGHDAIYYVDPNAVAPFGHSGLYYQDTKGNWYKADFAPENESPDVSALYSAKAEYEVKPLKNFDPNKTMKQLGENASYHDTTPKQDKSIQSSVTQIARDAKSGKTTYNVFTNNCKTVACTVLNRAGIKQCSSDKSPVSIPNESKWKRDTAKEYNKSKNNIVNKVNKIINKIVPKKKK